MSHFTRGQKGKLSELGLSDAMPVRLTLDAPGMMVDVSCFGLDAHGQLSDQRFMVFYKQTSAPQDAIVFDAGAPRALFRVDLTRLPAGIDKLVFCASTDQGGMRGLGRCALTLGDNDALTFAFSGADFTDEKAVIVGELYRRDGSWRFGAVGQGFKGGLAALLSHFGGAEMVSAAAPPLAAPPLAAPAAPAAKPVSLSKIRLEKSGDKVSLDKRAGQAFGRIRVNLNWHQDSAKPAAPAGFLGKLLGQSAPGTAAIDLDIGCLYELTDGARGAVQALGNSWGAFDKAPYIWLDGDDRSGSSSGGENIDINGAHFEHIKRVLVYAFIYDGVPNWAATDGVVTITMPDQPPVEVRLDSGARQPMCAIALIDNQGGRLQVTKLVEYFSGQGRITAHQEMDERYHFGLHWKPGSKS